MLPTRDLWSRRSFAPAAGAKQQSRVSSSSSGCFIVIIYAARLRWGRFSGCPRQSTSAVGEQRSINCAHGHECARHTSRNKQKLLLPHTGSGCARTSLCLQQIWSFRRTLEDESQRASITSHGQRSAPPPNPLLPYGPGIILNTGESRRGCRCLDRVVKSPKSLQSFMRSVKAVCCPCGKDLNTNEGVQQVWKHT